MGTALIKIKIMPLSRETDLEKIKKESEKIIEQDEGKNCIFEEQPIAFGLNALIAGFEIDEQKDTTPIEEKLRKVEEVNSVEVVDMRRAFG